MIRLLLIWLLLVAALPAVEYTLQASGVGSSTGSSGGTYTSHTMAGQVVTAESTTLSYSFASGYIAQVRKAGYVNATPTIDPIGDLAVLEDSGITTVALSGISDGSPDENQTLTISARSDNQSLILDPTITYTSPDTTGTLSFAPVSDAYGSATITVTVKDSGGTLNGASDTVQASFTVTVSPVNDSPSLDPLADLVIDEDAPQQTVALTGIGSGATNESQILSVRAWSSDTSKIPDPTVDYTSANLTGSISFTPVPDAFGQVNIIVEVEDSGGTANGGIDSFTRIFSVDILPVNDAPALVTNIGLTVEETKSGFISFNLLRTTDDDPPEGLTYTVTTVPTDGDLLRNGIALATNGTFTQADINAGILVYDHTGTTTGSDTFDFHVTDPGGLQTTGHTFTITIIADSGGTNTAPVVTLPSGTQTWIEGDAPLLLDSAATVEDAEGNLGGGTLSVTIIGGAETDDQLGIRNIGTGTGQIGVSGSIVTYEGNTLGSFSGGGGSTTLSVTLDASATPTRVQALVRALTYTHQSAAPSTTDRQVQVVLVDADGATSSPVATTVQIQAVNSAPEATFAQTTLAYVENDGAALIDTGTTVSDADSPDFNGGAVVLTIASGGGAEDVLGIQHQGGGSGQISLEGTSVGYEGTVIGSVVGGSGGTPLSVTLNIAATPTAVQALARALTFANDSDNFSTEVRTLGLTISDGDGGTSPADQLPVSMTATNDDPVLATPTTALTYVEGDGAVAISADGSVSDVDSPNFDTGIMRVDIATGSSPEDTIDVIDKGLITVSIDDDISYNGTVIGSYGGPVSGSTTMLIALNASADSTAVQALLRALHFTNASAAPVTGTRAVELSVTDGDNGSSAVRTVSITVEDQNSAPQVTLSGSAPSYTENATPVTIDGGISVTDADSTNFDGGWLRVAISANAGNQDVLEIAHTGFGAGEVGVVDDEVYYGGTLIGTIDISVANTLRVDLNFRSSPTAVSAVAAAYTFATSSQNPSTASRSIEFVVHDGDGDASATQTVSLAVVAINDAPFADDSTLATMNGVATGATLPATDHENDALSFTLTSQPANGSVVLDDDATGAITFTPSALGSGSFTYTVSDGSLVSDPVTVSTYVTGVDEPRPHVVSSPPMSATDAERFSYQVVVDVGQLGGTPDLTFRLVGAVPTGMTITEIGNTSALIDWTATGTAGSHYEFGVLFIDPAANRAGYQPVQFILQATPVAKPMGNG